MFDLSYARDLARRLSGQDDQAPSVTPDPSAAEYTRLPLKGETTATGLAALRGPSTGSSAPSPAPVTPVLPKDLLSIEDLIAWGSQLTRCTSSFVVDPQGFVISVFGEVPEDSFENIGATLAYAIEQMSIVDSHGGQIQWVDLQLANNRILVYPIVRSLNHVYMVAFLGYTDGSENTKAILMDFLQKHLLEYV